jgi:hypothetical protein
MPAPLCRVAPSLVVVVCSVDDKKTAVVLANPKTIEFQVCRSSLLPGLLKTLRENNGVVPLPIRLFEVGDAVRLAPGEIGARNVRKMAALYCGVSSGFEYIHGNRSPATCFADCCDADRIGRLHARSFCCCDRWGMVLAGACGSAWMRGD